MLSIKSEFAYKLRKSGQAREHFVVVLVPGSLDRIGEEGDWLRREVALALAQDLNVAPVTADGFQFSRDLRLPPEQGSALGGIECRVA